jgi:hypothetical protein
MIYMSIAGNQYADKVFSEHPIALWPLDEKVYYLSLIDDNDRLLSNWTLTNANSDDSPTLPDSEAPFPNEVSSAFIANTSSPVTVDVESPELFNLLDVNEEIATFSVNFFLYQKPDFINWFKVGYRYDDALSSPQEVISDEIPAPQLESWLNFNRVYSLPTSWSGNLKIFIQVNFADSSGGDATSRTLILNGLSVGQQSETTAYDSLGSEYVSIPSSAGITGMFGISADQYGTLSDNAYYLVRNNRLLAKNDGMPIIYGTDHSTKIYSSGVNLPSLIFPGKGMLNDSGRNNNYTLEAWIKLDPSTARAQRIIGPVSNNYGLYVKEGFLTLVIGDEIASHCVGEWYRPMLVHIVLKEGTASLIVNGEIVVTMDYDKKLVDLPNDRDWWGAYSYDNFSSFYIDCISILPYSISEVAAKRRFVYGQGTPSIQSIDNGFKGTSTTIDFSNSQYGPSVTYPDIYRWDAGYFNNFDANRDFLSVPDYRLPLINIGGRDVNEWYRDNYIVNTLEYPSGNHPNFITFRPNVTYDSNGDPLSWDYDGINYVDQSYLNFPSLNVLNNSVSSVYGIFETEEDIASDRTLMSFVNITNGDSFNIVVNSDSVLYYINDRLIHEEVITIGIEAFVGINFESAGTVFGYEISRFFSSPSSIQLYVGGNGINTFEGKIYSVGFCDQNNHEKISSNFADNGIAISENYEIITDHIASYTLLPEYEYEKLFLDISISSEWEEYYPLSYFAGYVKDENGDSVYDLDMIQINLGYSYVSSEGVWQYVELKDAYVGQTYADLQSSIYSNYFNLFKNNTTGDTVNVSNSSLQSYITFQTLASGANSPLSSFTYTKGLASDQVIYADEENIPQLPEKVYDTKFAFTDNTIVYPPKTNDFEDYAMVVHLELNQRAILKNPLKIRNMGITAKNLNYVSATSDPAQRNYIGTKFGNIVYPQIIDSGNIDYKSKNPIAIYKTGTPYLYTTKKSGIRLINKTDGSTANPSKEYMISLPVNQNASYEFFVGAVQFFMLSSIGDTNGQYKLMDINHKDGKISILSEKEDTGIFIRAYYNDGVSLTRASDIEFYQNGRYVPSPTINDFEWNMIGISFPNQLDFSEFSNGSIDVFGGVLLNNISYYLSEGLGVKTDINIRTWENVLNYESVTRLWSYWDTAVEAWRDVYVLGQSTSFFDTPANIYQSYVGTNRSVVDDNFGIRFNKTDSSLYTGVTWSSITAKPA